MSGERAAPSLPTRELPAGFRAERARSFDGAALEYVVSEPVPGALAAVLVHGWGCHRGFFGPQLARLARDRQILALDLAGHGGSGPAERRYAIDEFARDVAAVADAAELDRFVAAGHSMGGAVAVDAARALGPRVPAVVTLDSLTYASVYPRIPDDRVTAAMAAYRADFPAAVRATMEPVFVEETPPALRAAILTEITATPREPGILAIGGLLSWDGEAAVAACAVPIACLNAQALFPESVGTPYLDRLDIELLDGVGHFLQLEAPTRVGAALGALLARVA